VRIEPSALAFGAEPRCEATGTDPDGQALTWTYTWRVGGQVLGREQQLKGASLRRGQLLTCVATASDGEAKAEGTQDELVGNAPPSAKGATITPATPRSTEDLKCAAQGAADPDGDAVTVSYAWAIGGTTLQDQTGATLPASAHRSGQSVTCAVTPSDLEVAGTQVVSAPVVIGNAPPSVEAVTLSPAEVTTADALTCAATSTSDPDGDPVEFAYAWTMNGRLLADVAEKTLPASATKKGQILQCAITPSDRTESGKAMGSNKVTVANSAPVLASATLTPAEARTTDPLTCAPGEATDADGDAVRFAYAWTIDGAQQALTTAVLPASAHHKGQEIHCAITPLDAAGLAGAPVVSPAVRVLNTPPTVTAPRLSPAAPNVATPIACSPGAGRDVDGDAVTVTTQWMVDGKPVTTVVGDTLAVGAFHKGQQVVCLSASADSDGKGAVEASAAVAVTNTLPTLASAVVLPEDPATSDTLTCQAAGGADADGDEVSLGYEWLISGVPVAGQTDATLASDRFRKGQTVACRVTPADPEGKGTRVTSSSVSVRNTPPTGGRAELGPVNPLTGDALTCTASDALDVDEDRVTFTFAWFVNEVDASVTGTTLLPGKTKKGDSIRCEATPTDGGAGGKAVRSNAVAIGNSPPTMTSAQVTPAQARVADTLTCEPGRGADPDNDEVVFSYRWMVDGVVAPSTQATLTPGAFKKGQQVTCEVTPTDGTTPGAAVESPAVRILNTLPEIASVSLSPREPATTDELTCKSGEGRDADGDTVTSTFRWIAGGAVVGEDSATLSGRFTRRDQSVVCEVVPGDGEGPGAPVRSNAILIRNTAPSLEGAHVEPLEPDTASNLSCITGGTRDIDGDLVRLDYAWEIDGQPVSGTVSTLPSSQFHRGQSVRCIVTPRDGTLSGPAVPADPVVIRNTAPVLPSARITNASPTKAHPIECEAGRAVDRDGDTVSFEYAWTVDGEKIAVTGAQLSPSDFSRGSRVACIVTPTDGTDRGAAVTSAAVTVVNTPPEISTVSLSPTVVATDGVLEAAAQGFDVDGDTVSYTWRWFVNDRLVPGETSVRLDGKAFNRDERVRAEASASDGTRSSAAKSSEVVTVKNTPPTSVSTFLTDPEGGFVPLQCVVVGQSQDIDGDKVTYRFQFTRNGTHYRGEQLQTLFASDTVPAAELHADDRWSCKVTPTDGDRDGPSTEWSLRIVAAQAAGGSSHSCALDTLGAVHCWGLDDYGVATAPEGHFRRLAVGGWHNCAISAEDNSLACWGHRTYGQTKPPAGEWSEVTSGWWHSCAMDVAGKVTCWGQAADGRTTPPNDTFVLVDAGAQHTCGITTDGVAKCWGDNAKGQSIPPGGRFIDIAAGESHTCGLREDGSITCWGNNEHGQIKAPGGSFVSIEAAAASTCALADDGALTCWGLDNYGQASPKIDKLRVLGKGTTHQCGIGMDGEPVCWGRDNYAQLKMPK